MKIAPVADVKARLSAYLDKVEAEGPVVITRNGKPVAVLLAPRDEADLERLIVSHSPRVMAILEGGRTSVREGHGLTRDAFWKSVEKRAKKRSQTSGV